MDVESDVAADSVDGGDFEGLLPGNGAKCVASENWCGYNMCVRIGTVRTMQKMW